MESLKPGDVVNLVFGGEHAGTYVLRVLPDVKYDSEEDSYFNRLDYEIERITPSDRPTHEVLPIGPATTAAALARAVLAGDTSAVAALIDAAAEAFDHAARVDVAQADEKLAAEVRNAKGRANDGVITYTHGLPALFQKLRDLGYARAVEEYLRPAALVPNEYATGTVGIPWSYALQPTTELGRPIRNCPVPQVQRYFIPGPFHV